MNCCWQNGGCQWGSWDGGGRWCSWSTSNWKMDQGRLCRTHNWGGKKNLVQKVGAFWSQVLDRREQRGPSTCWPNTMTSLHWKMEKWDALILLRTRSKWLIQNLFKERLRNIPSGVVEEVKDHLDHMLDMGAIKPSKSAWSSAVVLVQKKDRGLRFCINFQRLNAQTQKDAFPLLWIHDIIYALSGSKYYTTVDLLSGSWQSPMEESFK